MKNSISETYLTPDLEHFLEDDGLSHDREIFLSGKTKEIGNIVTENKKHFKYLFKELNNPEPIYTPKLYSLTKDENSIYNGLNEFNVDMEKARRIKRENRNKMNNNSNEAYLNRSQRFLLLLQEHKEYSSSQYHLNLSQRVILLCENILNKTYSCSSNNSGKHYPENRSQKFIRMYENRDSKEIMM